MISCSIARQSLQQLNPRKCSNTKKIEYPIIQMGLWTRAEATPVVLTIAHHTENEIKSTIQKKLGSPFRADPNRLFFETKVVAGQILGHASRIGKGMKLRMCFFKLHGQSEDFCIHTKGKKIDPNNVIDLDQVNPFSFGDKKTFGKLREPFFTGQRTIEEARKIIARSKRDHAQSRRIR